MQVLKWFKDTSKDDLAEVGGKGANLGELVKAGVPVPDGFIVTSKVYFEFLKENGIDTKIKEILKDFNPNDSKLLNSQSVKIKSLILHSQPPLSVKNQIKEAYRQLIHNNKEGYVAVRSSATAEDLPGASFAGQQATFLNVKGENELLKAVVSCWASLFEPRAIFYREEKKFDHLKVGIAVPVQLMVQSKASGIIFTVDPITSDKNQIMIEAGLGLGEAVVSGSITPDRYLVDKKTLKIKDKEINAQEWKIEKVGKVNRHITLSKEDKNRQKISDEQIVKLAEYARKIEEYYSSPQDIEWAIEDKIFIVQSRPITTLKEKTEGSKKIVEPSQTSKVILKGAAASAGTASGKVNIIHSASEIEKIKKGDVLVTEMTTPDFVPAMKRAAAIITDSGGRTCHAAIVSRELGIPCVVGTKSATSVLKNGQIVTVNGSQGEVREGAQMPTKEQTVRSDLGTMRQEMPITATKIYVNLAEVELAEEVAKKPVDGVGLLRAEFMIAGIGEHPKALIEKGRSKFFVDKLSEGLERFAKAFSPRPIIYRATDFKSNEYKNLKGGEKYESDESNPMIGYRGCFRYIKEPELFALELEAIKRVRELGFKSLQLMIPFVRTVDEMKKVIELVDNSKLTSDREFKLFMMAELPSNVILIDEFLELPIDGISIGSNDLTQLILGVDRDNEKLAEEFDERNPAVMQAMEKLIRSTRKKGKLVSICGQAPSDYPEIVQLFVESGATSISVNPDMVEKTRRLVASIERRILLDQIIG